MSNYSVSSDAYKNFLTDLEESILLWQRDEKLKRNDRQFNARRHFASILGYKDVSYLYRVLDCYDNSRTKLGFRDAETILNEIGDLTPLENYLAALKDEK